MLFIGGNNIRLHTCTWSIEQKMPSLLGSILWENIKKVSEYV